MFKQPKIFLYHELYKDREINPFIKYFDISHSIDQFEEHLKAISDKYKLISPKEFIKGYDENIDLSEFALITFDDGYYESFNLSHDILNSYECGGIWFINSFFSENTEVFWLSKLLDNFINKEEITLLKLKGFFGSDCKFLESSAENFNEIIKTYYSTELSEFCKDLGYGDYSIKSYLSSEDICKFSNNEIFYFANHTASHPNIKNINKNTLEKELKHANEFLEKSGTNDHNMFAIPFGIFGEHWNKKSIKYLNELNYEHIFSVDDSRFPMNDDKIHVRYQVPININSQSEMLDYISSI